MGSVSGVRRLKTFQQHHRRFLSICVIFISAKVDLAPPFTLRDLTPSSLTSPRTQLSKTHFSNWLIRNSNPGNLLTRLSQWFIHSGGLRLHFKVMNVCWTNEPRHKRFQLQGLSYTQVFPFHSWFPQTISERLPACSPPTILSVVWGGVKTAASLDGESVLLNIVFSLGLAIWLRTPASARVFTSTLTRPFALKQLYVIFQWSTS